MAFNFFDIPTIETWGPYPCPPNLDIENIWLEHDRIHMMLVSRPQPWESCSFHFLSLIFGTCYRITRKPKLDKVKRSYGMALCRGCRPQLSSTPREVSEDTSRWFQIPYLNHSQPLKSALLTFQISENILSLAWLLQISNPYSLYNKMVVLCHNTL